jgi:ApaG protein
VRPVEIAGRNRMFRAMIIQSIRNDTEWKHGEYTTPSVNGLIAAEYALWMMTSSPLRLQKANPTPACYDWALIMADLRSELAPVSEAVTNSIRVEAMSQHSPQNSRPHQGEWIFQYTVRITNQGQETVQLLSRHWIITDGVGHIEEVRGPGVVGEQPVLELGQSFQYSSWCPLKTPMGVMRGTYQMVGVGGRRFDIEIAPFALKAQYAVN